METSILTSTKKVLGVDEAYTAFDLDIITHINSAFSTLTQLGVGPPAGFMIEDDAPVWTDFITDGDLQYNPVKSYIYLRTRQLFDPPSTSYLISAFDQQIKELEWRLNVHREETGWTEPGTPETPPVGPEPTLATCSPANGPPAGGTTVVLTGTNLADVTDVTFGASPADSFLADSSTQITCISPGGVAGQVQVGVSNQHGDSNTLSFTYM